jgi:hypothetical protein
MTLQNIPKKIVWLGHKVGLECRLLNTSAGNFVHKHKKWWICWWIAKHLKHNNDSYQKNMEVILSQLVLQMFLVVNWWCSIGNIVVHCKNKIDPILSSQNKTMPTYAPYWCLSGWINCHHWLLELLAPIPWSNFQYYLDICTNRW